DYDNDGSLDLFVTNSAKWTLDDQPSSKYFQGKSGLRALADSPKEINALYHNNRDGTFTEVTEPAGLKGSGWGGDVAAFDYDEDGNIDLFVTNMFGLSQLYRNLGDGKFVDVTPQTLGRTSWGAIGSKVFDGNNDGKLDLLIVDMHSDMWAPFENFPGVLETVQQSSRKKFSMVTGPISQFDRNAFDEEKRLVDSFQVEKSKVVFGNTMFQNSGNGKFEEVSDKARLESFWPWGIATGDFDNNQNEDVFLPSGMGYPFFYWPNALMMGNDDGIYEDRSRTEGIEPPARGIHFEQKLGGKAAARSSRCASSADFDGDGRLDLMVNNFNDQPYYFKNEFPQRNYVAFRLRGTKSNRDAVGAVMRLFVGNKILTRQVHSAGGYLSQSSKTLHWGLGEHSEIDRVEIRWPSGLRQKIDNLAINTLHELTEPEE
ncbi:MAG: CRTAC1 family protein, partial [Planctomycetaceae bacterium]|nr:CRTAC1 family protein [Planctomycetaceae bacterium]